jgi:outer membrane protein OmpA-like peptidoglycan-associated protein
MQVRPGGDCNLSTHARERATAEGQQSERTPREPSRGSAIARAIWLAQQLAFCALLWGTTVPHARADEPWMLHLEATLGTPVADPQRDWYGVGGGLAAGVTRPLASWLAVEGQLRGALFLDGDKPKSAGVKDPDSGTLNTASVGLQLRLPDGTVRRGTGPWLGALVGAALTGKEVRASWEAGLGYGFALSERIALGPVIRYVQVIQPDGGLNSSDARIVLAGLRMSLFDRTEQHEQALKRTALDRDGDGIPDASDKCIDVPEDRDGFQDEDGCPEDDNDGDGIPDASDGCPNIAEDKDGFQDEDGCVDEDNDRDGILDTDDQCPLEPETINGERDDDGCPDQGLIVMQDDRVSLQERLLFDTNSARIKKSAEPILRAIVKLQSQHPEWTKVRIEGHADQRGDAKFNQDLSERRATAAREALVALGVPSELIVAEGYGASKLLSQDPTGEGFALNRRVEFVVVGRQENASAPMFTPRTQPAATPGVKP